MVETFSPSLLFLANKVDISWPVWGKGRRVFFLFVFCVLFGHCFSLFWLLPTKKGVVCLYAVWWWGMVLLGLLLGRVNVWRVACTGGLLHFVSTNRMAAFKEDEAGQDPLHSWGWVGGECLLCRPELLGVWVGERRLFGSLYWPQVLAILSNIVLLIYIFKTSISTNFMQRCAQ